MKNPALKSILQAVDAKKGDDLGVLDISEIASFASFFVMASGDSSRQIQAIADEVEDRMRREHDVRPGHIEGYRNAEWILLDYGDIVVHVFSRKARAFYDLERLWRDARRIDSAALLQGAPAAPPAPPSRRRVRK